jgi:undecaprenyl-diphosphatase
LLGAVTAAAPTAFDQWLAPQVQSLPWGEMPALPQLASDIGGGIYGTLLMPLAVGAVLAWKRQWRALALLAGVFALHYVMISPKLFIEAHRPSPLFGVEGAGGFESFPSGHVEWAVSFYGFIAYLAARAYPRRAPWIAVAYAGVVVLTMLSRIELGRHWPLDTVAGLLVGLIAVRVLVALHVLPGLGRPDEVPALQRAPAAAG